ncbi:glycosyltransferase family 39 protein [Micromonospora sp. R77]|uniref:glycosyltransferase family 39 protein n=1 Tax=Micromonospora sp. R77 TaxID=2925836 RepID=UPI001F609529|nr:glycosyltransferase family 39 protein [Micromonospora sp. R77]MCI4065055.1 glycosyltransferase family 39 protein [Micromonospora sp. R77]
MRATSTDQTAIIVRIPAESPALAANEPAVWKPTAEDQPAEPEPLRNPRLTMLAWLLPMLVLAGIGSWGLATPGLSEDELATWGMVSIGWTDFREVMANVDATVGPYYVVERLWVALVGDSDLLLRLPSLLFAVGAAGLVAAIGIRLGGRRVGLAAGLIFAVLPGVSRYAQDARPYALVLLAAAWSTYALLRLLDRPRAAAYLQYALAVLLLGSAHVVALLLLLAHLLIVVRTERDRRVRLSWAGAAFVGLSPVLPMLYLGGAQSGSQIGWIPPLSWDRLAETPDRLFGATIVAGAVLALALSALSLRPPAQVATIWALVPAAGLAVAALVTPLWVPRYLLFVVPAWALLASMALRRLTVLRGLVAVLGIAVVAVPAQQAVRTSYGHDFASRDISLIVRSHRAPGDAVLFGPFTDGDQRTSRDAFMRYLSPTERPADKLMARPPRTGGTLGAQECPDREVPSCFGSPARVWVIRKGSYPNILQNIGAAKEQLLRTSFVQSQTWSVKGFTIALYSRKPTA